MFLGQNWIDEHITRSRAGFLCLDTTTPATEERQRMRRILLAEMLYNLQDVEGFSSCFGLLSDGQIESTYAVLDIARIVLALGTDKGIKIKFMPDNPTKRRAYDLALTFSDGVRVAAEAKRKLEETAPSIRTINPYH